MNRSVRMQFPNLLVGRNLRLRAPLLAAATFAVAAGACASVEVEEPSAELGSTGLALTFDTLDDTDVAGFSFTATEVDCATGAPIDPANVYTAVEDLEDMYLPGTDGMFADAPLDANSQHLFSDHFFALPVGCYDVVVQPITEDGEPSEDCLQATDNNVEVLDGETTEILLISQCLGDPSIGGLDVIAVLNHPPTLTAVTYDPSKFICEHETTICVTATDVDNDPIVIVPSGDDWTLVSQTDGEDGTSCFTFSFPEPGDYNVTFTAYDMGYNADGTLVSIEDLLIAQGDPAPSNDAITVPVHVLPEDDCINTCECPEGFDLTPAGDECIRVETVDVQIAGPQYRVCKAGTSSAYGWGGAQYPGGLIDNTLAFFTQRLNDIGVWACDNLDTPFIDEPVDEWIGFSVCLDLEEAGDYVVGMASDNRMRFSLNGMLTFVQNTGATANFNYWWMNPIALSSGLNIVELEGRNDGSIAAFGADIYGPFPASSLTSDASMAALDYPANLVWSTLDVIGQPFTNGETSGFSCPDGFALNTCEGEVTCTRIERVDCQ